MISFFIIKLKTNAKIIKKIFRRKNKQNDYVAFMLNTYNFNAKKVFAIFCLEHFLPKLYEFGQTKRQTEKKNLKH